jgi:hypothetical protein
MSISRHVSSLQQHLAQYGLYKVPDNGQNASSEVFKICFLNKYEMERWRELRESEEADKREEERAQNDLHG